MSSVDPRLEEWIQTEIDGTISPAERAELHERIAADPGLRERRAALRSVAGALDGLESVEPPPGIRDDVLAAVLPARELRRPGRATGWNARTVLKYGYAFAAGLALGVFGWQLATETSRTPEAVGLRGTMAPVEQRSSLTVPGGALQVRHRTVDGIATVELSLDAGSAMDIHLAFDADGLAVQGIEPGGGGPQVLEVTRGLIRLAGLSGDGGAIRFEQKEPGMTIELTVLRDSTVLARRRFELP